MSARTPPESLGPPEPDSRAASVGLAIDAHRGYHHLQAVAADWPTTIATPAGPGDMLKTARAAFALAFYNYEQFAIAGVWSIFATEAALRAKFEVDHTVQLSQLVRRAEDEGLLPERGWGDERLDMGRRLRNKAVHQGQLARWSPGMAEPVIRASHEFVAGLFLDDR